MHRVFRISEAIRNRKDKIGDGKRKERVKEPHSKENRITVARNEN